MEMRWLVRLATQTVRLFAETATPVGKPKLASPLPSLPKEMLWLQSVEEPVARVQTETRLLLVSATQTVRPSAERATPDGYLKLASPEPGPLPKVVLGLHSVEVLGGRVQTEMRWLWESATQAVRSSTDTATPNGFLKLASSVPWLPKV